MDWQLHYERLICRARSRQIEGYSERHHVIPRCMGGSNTKSNIVRLTAEEHYVAHQLLVKIYPDNVGLVSAAVAMSWNLKNGCRNNKLYGWLRRRHAYNQSVRIVSEETRRKIGEHSKGKKWSLGLVRSHEIRQKISAAKFGKPTALLGRPKTEEHKLKMRKPKSPEHIAKLREVFSDPLIRAAISARNLGKPKTQAQRDKQSLAMKGRPSPRKGIPMSAESKAKLSLTQRARLAARRGDNGQLAFL